MRMILSYACVLTSDQNLDASLVWLREVGVELIYEEKVMGTKR